MHKKQNTSPVHHNKGVIRQRRDPDFRWGGGDRRPAGLTQRRTGSQISEISEKNDNGIFGISATRGSSYVTFWGSFVWDPVNFFLNIFNPKKLSLSEFHCD